MKIIHRKIDLSRDIQYILEKHCQINYECDTPWKRKMTYDEYRSEWFSLHQQIAEFSDYLKETMEDNRTIAEIIETVDGSYMGYLWVPFHADEENGFLFAEIQDIFVEDEYRNSGVASTLLTYAEDMAKKHGAKVIRSGTGCENIKSIRLHEQLGYYPYRYEFEKVL